MKSMKSTLLVTLSLAALATGSALLPAHAQTYTAQTVLSGLFNPRGLAFDASGALYVAEAGVGGPGPTIVDGGGASVSYGETGGVTRLQNGVQTRLLSNLPSLATRTNGAPGAASTGLQDIVFGANGTAYGVIGFGADPNLRAMLASGGAANAAELGSLVQFSLSGVPSASVVTDLSAYERTNNPDGGEYNSNPYGLTTLTGGGFAVADAGGNDILLLNAAGIITGSVVLPAYPNTTPANGGPFYQSVPTGVIQAPDGTLYVSELGGYPFTVGSAHIDVIRNGALINSFGGFTNLTDVTYFNGGLYALQLSTNGISGAVPPGPGELLQIDPATGASQVLYNGLSFPGGLVVGPDNAFYVTNNITSPGGGSVLRIAAVPEPGSLALLGGMGVMGAGFFARRKRTSRKRVRRAK